MTMKTLWTAGVFCLLGTMAVLTQQPNVIFTPADDLGYGDLSSYNLEAELLEKNNRTK